MDNRGFTLVNLAKLINIVIQVLASFVNQNGDIKPEIKYVLVCGLYRSSN